VVVADHELHAVYTACLEALEELPPVRLGLAACDTAAEDRPLSVGGDTDGGEDGTWHDGPAVPDLFVSSVEDQIGDLAERPVLPGGQLFVDFG